MRGGMKNSEWRGFEKQDIVVESGEGNGLERLVLRVAELCRENIAELQILSTAAVVCKSRESESGVFYDRSRFH
jgi:hypothetical protein